MFDQCKEEVELFRSLAIQVAEYFDYVYNHNENMMRYINNVKNIVTKQKEYFIHKIENVQAYIYIEPVANISDDFIRGMD